MSFRAMTILIWLAVSATALAQSAQGASSDKATDPGASSKGQLSEIRTLVHELQGRNEKLSDLMDQYRSLVEQRPQGRGEQLDKWNAALERLLRRVDDARAAVVETVQRLDQAGTEHLPTALGKDVAKARNEAGAQRTAAEQALAKSKPAKASASKQAKKKPATEKPAPPIPDDL